MNTVGSPRGWSAPNSSAVEAIQVRSSLVRCKPPPVLQAPLKREPLIPRRIAGRDDRLRPASAFFRPFPQYERKLSQEFEEALFGFPEVEKQPRM
jgi:hypothetical protein